MLRRYTYIQHRVRVPASQDGRRFSRRREGGLPLPDRRPVDDEHRHRRRERDRSPGARPAPGWERAGARHGQQRGAAQAVPDIVAQVDVPVIGDFHYNGHLLLTKYPACARALAKYRINPGNVGAKRRDEHFRTIIEVALANDRPVRIGVNWGSLDQQLLTELMDANAQRPEPLDARDVMIEAMLASALRSAELAEECGLPHDRIILSAKLSGVQDLVEVYRRLAKLSDYALHLGLTEAGMGAKGIIASAAGLAILLQDGIGDTIRVSLTPRPGGDRTEEVQVAQQVLQSLGLRSFTPQVSACPGCGRTTSTFFQEMAEQIQAHLQEQLP